MLSSKDKIIKQDFIGGSGARLNLFLSGDDKLVIKSISKSREKAAKLAAQYEWLKARQELNHIVRVYDLHQKENSSHYTMEYLENYISLNQYLSQCSADFTTNILGQIMDYISREIHTNKAVVQSKELFKQYLLTKLYQNIKTAAHNSETLNEILNERHVYINGIKHLNFDECYEQLLSNPQVLKNHSKIVLCDIHGDLTLENIFINPEDSHFVLIDPNCKNPISTPLIDYSKLMQSASSKYEKMKNIVISREGQDLNYSTDSLAPDHVTTATEQLLKSRLSKREFENVKLYEAINFARILPYKIEQGAHNHLLYFGSMIKLLNEYLTSIK